nr:Retrovirus-related Pol polyprotein from transposon RE1 [Ipomoea batatas]
MMEINEVPTLPEDPTIAQMREYREEKKKMNKAKTCIHLALTDEVFTKIMTYYSERLKKVVNKIRLLGEELPDDRVVEKILVTLPKRFESKISSVEESRDLSEISLADLLHALEAQEQRRTYRNESNIEGAFKANEVSQIQPKGKNQQQPWKKKGSQNGANRGKFPPCQHCIKLISDVMLVPEISQNLLSVRQLLEKDVKQEKLDPKAEYGVFVGYSNVTKGYRIFQPLTGKLKVCTYVKFDETARRNWDKMNLKISRKNQESFLKMKELMIFL